MQLETDRLILRHWLESDRPVFAAMNADPKVMEFFPSKLDRKGSDELVDIINEGFDNNSYGLWAAERKDTGEFIGFIGLHNLSLETDFCPSVEIGWRLASQHWNQGFATEGAMKALEAGLSDFQLNEIVAITAKSNVRSMKVMEKIGMKYEKDFLHPRLSPDSPIYQHVLYKAIKN